MVRKKILIAVKDGDSPGGPTRSHQRILKSSLNEHYDLVPLRIPEGRLGLFNPGLTLRLIRQIRAERPDLIQIIGLELIGFHQLLAAKLAGRYKILTAVHGSASESLALKTRPLKRRVLSALEKLTARFSDAIFGVSEYVGGLDSLEAGRENYLGHVYNLVSAVDDPHHPSVDLRHACGFDPDDFLVISVGRVEKEKGFDVLAEVIRACKNPEMRYVIVGDGSYLSEMKDATAGDSVRDKVVFLGYRDDVFHLLKQADAFVLPSKHETFCMAAAEAVMQGVPLIVPPHGGLKEIVVDGVNGFIAHDNDPGEYGMLLNRLFEDETLHETFRANAARIAAERFGDDVVIQKLKSIYDAVIQRREPSSSRPEAQ